LSELTEHYEALIETVYAGPLFQLVERLEQEHGSSVPSAPSRIEYSTAASSIILAVLFLEAYLNLSRYLVGSQERGVLDYYNELMTSGAYRQEFTELVVLSEILAHDLRWRSQQNGTDGPPISARELPAISTHAFDQAVDRERQATRTLGLPIVPTRLTLDDVRRTIKTVAAILPELRTTLRSHRGTPPVGNHDFGKVAYRDRSWSFLAAAEAL
jgi:hypothetical protein